MKKTKKDEMNLVGYYKKIREGLVGRCQNKLVRAEEVVDEAFLYVSSGVLKDKIPMPKTAKDLCRLIAYKVKLMIRDACRSRNRTHNGRSLVVDSYLDYEDEDGGFPVMDCASMIAYSNTIAEENRKYLCDRALKVLKAVLDKIRMTETNKRVFTECFMEGRNRVEVARQYHITRNNCDAIVFRVLRALAKIGPGIFRSMSEDAA